jgi:hypothetical protein
MWICNNINNGWKNGKCIWSNWAKSVWFFINVAIIRPVSSYDLHFYKIYKNYYSVCVCVRDILLAMLTKHVSLMDITKSLQLFTHFSKKCLIRYQRNQIIRHLYIENRDSFYYLSEFLGVWWEKRFENKWWLAMLIHSLTSPPAHSYIISYSQNLICAFEKRMKIKIAFFWPIKWLIFVLLYFSLFLNFFLSLIPPHFMSSFFHTLLPSMYDFVVLLILLLWTIYFILFYRFVLSISDIFLY